MQIWTIKGDKAYIFAYQANPSDFSKELANFEKIANSLKFEDIIGVSYYNGIYLPPTPYTA